MEGWVQGTRGERTSNIQPMSVTLDVSKLTGWLNAHAAYRVGKRTCDCEGRGAGWEREDIRSAMRGA